MQFFVIAFAALAAASPMVAERAADPAAVATTPTYDNGGHDGGNGGHDGGNGGGNGGGNTGGKKQFKCPGLLQTPQCCQTDILDLASLTCEPLRADVSSRDTFKAECAKTGATANCCLLPVLGQALVCQNV
ncbi:uncharacterized protein RCC_08977 [Ramularia collo-cygni]|uniref:Hydrophobin 2 n=1 Tax=Ramularia collo-cygni TaxID=112498 RepID=A0A2D3V1J5_9PEZI|nr:uncharacterized protein RCC_08977 [Ramularia collo-cygni]CZT23266.1 uncharacterized protein RCC_08977 [Ramularia collo-cygni]